MSISVDNGINKNHSDKIVTSLQHLLADTYALYLKTQNFHWNVESGCFFMFHEAFEEQYTKLRDAVDELAERIRQFGQRAPGSFKEFLKLTEISECDSLISVNEMLKALLHDHELLIKKYREHSLLTQEANDKVTDDLYTRLMTEHEKIAWMLRSSLVK